MHSARKGAIRPGKGLGQYLSATQQHAWRDGLVDLPDAAERCECFEQRLKYARRVERLFAMPQAAVLGTILASYGRSCLPVPRTTERTHWSVSCLPSSPDRPLVRVNASWMELFTLYAEGDDLRARFIVHLSDCTRDGSLVPDEVDPRRLGVESRCDLSLSPSTGGSDLVVICVAGTDRIGAFIAGPASLKAIRRFNISHMNRGRNAYQASHSYALADIMLGDAEPGP